MFKRICSTLILFIFLTSTVLGPDPAHASELLGLPAPGVAITTGDTFAPAVLRGMVIHPEDPLHFEFILDRGEAEVQNDPERLSSEALAKEEARAGRGGVEGFPQEDETALSQRLVNYFLAALTTSEKDLWVNLSPYEDERIITDDLITTELGRDLLAQDYLLKQLTASLLDPDKPSGRKFWGKVYGAAYNATGSVDIPQDLFHKVWIMPDTASVIEKNDTVFVTEARMKVMLASDRVAMKEEAVIEDVESERIKDLMREVLLPVIEEEVNTSRAFAPLRQLFHSLVLAKWYKEAVVDSALGSGYVDQGKVVGVDVSDPALREQIFARYTEAFRQGVVDKIREEKDPLTGEIIPRRYFTGGFTDSAMQIKHQPTEEISPTSLWLALGRFAKPGRLARIVAQLRSAVARFRGELNGTDVLERILRERPGSWSEEAPKVLNDLRGEAFLTSAQTKAVLRLFPLAVTHQTAFVDLIELLGRARYDVAFDKTLNSLRDRMIPQNQEFLDRFLAIKHQSLRVRRADSLPGAPGVAVDRAMSGMSRSWSYFLDRLKASSLVRPQEQAEELPWDLRAKHFVGRGLLALVRLVVNEKALLVEDFFSMPHAEFFDLIPAEKQQVIAFLQEPKIWVRVQNTLKSSGLNGHLGEWENLMRVLFETGEKLDDHTIASVLSYLEVADKRANGPQAEIPSELIQLLGQLSFRKDYFYTQRPQVKAFLGGERVDIEDGNFMLDDRDFPRKFYLRVALKNSSRQPQVYQILINASGEGRVRHLGQGKTIAPVNFMQDWNGYERTVRLAPVGAENYNIQVQRQPFDAAMSTRGPTAVQQQGGVDLSAVELDRSGDAAQRTVYTPEALRAMLQGADGLKAEIIAITPLPDPAVLF